MTMTNDRVAPALFTIGHSNHEWPRFVRLLQAHRIDAIADVRSSPYSRFVTQYNRGTIELELRKVRIRYAFLGEELGARRGEKECYLNGKVSYPLVAQLPAFRSGLDRLRSGLKTYRIALMCAEKDPITCHRMVLVTRALRDEKIVIHHILADGRAEPAAETEERLLRAAGLPSLDLFRPRAEMLADAFRLQGERLAYTEQVESPELQAVES